MVLVLPAHLSSNSISQDTAARGNRDTNLIVNDEQRANFTDVPAASISASGNSGDTPPDSVLSREESRPPSIASISSRASSYRSALASLRSISTYATAFSRLRGSGLDLSHQVTPPIIKPESEYQRLIRQMGLLLPPWDELNWSGRGQHVEYSMEDSLPLLIGSAIGHSATALVDQVYCRRIKLARKSMTLTRRTVLETAMNEVVHLQRLRHSHVIQLVGTYLQGRTFAILLYPVCDSNLTSYMEGATSSELMDMIVFFPCIAHAVDYIHSANIKHMDIKPGNILVRKKRYGSGIQYHHVYIADFGISRHFETDHHSETDSPTARSFKYCAPEVAKQDKRGRKADIFSLGCVFIEMLTVLSRRGLDELEDYISDENGSYHDNLPRVRLWIHSLQLSNTIPHVAQSVYSLDQTVRTVRGIDNETIQEARRHSPHPTMTDKTNEMLGRFVVEFQHDPLAGLEGEIQSMISEDSTARPSSSRVLSMACELCHCWDPDHAFYSPNPFCCEVSCEGYDWGG